MKKKSSVAQSGLEKEIESLKVIKVLFLVPYPSGVVPSQRFRFEQYLDLLVRNDIKVTQKPFYTQSTLRTFRNGSFIARVVSIALSYIARLFFVPKILAYDFVFIHREAIPVGPPVMEWFIAKVLRKKIIYDFDDAIWLTDNLHESMFIKLAKWRSKVASICRWSHKVVVGNGYLANYASRFSSSVIVIPTTIDTDLVHNPTLFPLDSGKHNNTCVIGWTGSSSTLKYLSELFPVFSRIETNYPNTKFLVIADEKPDWTLKNLFFKKWSADTEISDLMLADIGVMPLPDDEWTKGKCGFKALQYMAMGIPAVVASVGVNTEIVEDGVHGYVCKSDADWYDSLKKLITNNSLRIEMGMRGRDKVIKKYSVASNTVKFVSLFRE